MAPQTTEQLRSKRCRACEGEADRLTPDQAQQYLDSLDGWALEHEAKLIRKHWEMPDFAFGLDFLNRVGRLAEQEDHHPDLHLTGYRHVTIELSTHAVGGLSENDFILASKIDELAAVAQS